MNLDHASCASCRFSQPMPPPAPIDPDSVLDFARDRWGEPIVSAGPPPPPIDYSLLDCHRYPKVWSKVGWAWPRMRPDDFCGEWVPGEPG